MPNNRDDIIQQLTDDIDRQAGAIPEDDLDSISSAFNKTLADALKSYNSSAFDDDGFIKRMSELQLGDKNDKEIMKNILSNIRADYVNADTLNQQELLQRRDIYNICTQMPEMQDAVKMMRDSIVECNVATGEVSRSLTFEDHDDEDTLEDQVIEIEKRHKLLHAIKNTVVLKALMNGEQYIHVVPYAKLFAELEALHDVHDMNAARKKFHESVPGSISHSFTPKKSLYSSENVKVLTEAVSAGYKTEATDISKIDSENSQLQENTVVKNDISNILQNIDVYNGSSLLYSEHGYDGLKTVLLQEYKEYKRTHSNPDTHFSEAMQRSVNPIGGESIFDGIDQDNIDFSSYGQIKGCYIKYLDGLRMVPIRIDKRIVGYYYISTTMDLQTNPANPNGIVDLSYQTYTRDRNMVETLANLIIKSFDKKMLEKNVQLKSEIADIIMAHKFAEGRLSFIYIPENEVVRIVINEDEFGRGHSVLEPSLFPARTYLMLTMYNLMYTLNNNTTRVFHMRSSGLNKDYGSQIQRLMRLLQSRRITIDDIYSYSGVLNKIGGMGQMVLPSGRGDLRAFDVDTIAAAERPFDNDFLDIQRRQALSGTGNPSLMVMNAIDEVDFAKTLEIANTRYLTTVSSYKIDMNEGITTLYQRLLKYETDLSDEVIMSFRFQFNQIKQPELVITNDMIGNFNTMVELIEGTKYTKKDLEDENGNWTQTRIKLRRKLAELYLAQIEFSKIDEIFDQLDEEKPEEKLQAAVDKAKITNEDIKTVQETEE